MRTVTGDQGNASVLRRWRAEMGGGGFDAVIDDGGHRNSQLAATFEAFWPEVRPGGVYFLEDLHVGYASRYEDTAGGAIVACVRAEVRPAGAVGNSGAGEDPRRG